jgi:HB1, ASXL, restriction endonuclease HTH domain
MSESSSDFSAIRIGTRVRFSDGAEGRITWANATSVKIQWDDGEKITWKRAELASKGLTILDADAAPQEVPQTPPAEASTHETNAEAAPAAPEMNAEAVPSTHEANVAPASAATEAPAEPAAVEATATTPDAAPAEPVQPAKKRIRRTKPAEPKPGRTSALDAAAKVLAEEGRPMNCQELIGAMAMKGYWSSPGGKTPAATLYSALLREIDTKGDAARFVKVGKGMFALRPQA